MFCWLGVRARSLLVIVAVRNSSSRPAPPSHLLGCSRPAPTGPTHKKATVIKYLKRGSHFLLPPKSPTQSPGASLYAHVRSVVSHSALWLGRPPLSTFKVLAAAAALNKGACGCGVVCARLIPDAVYHSQRECGYLRDDQYTKDSLVLLSRGYVLCSRLMIRHTYVIEVIKYTVRGSPSFY